MKLFSSILGTLVLGFSLGVMAEGREVGNGGDAVVCYTDSTKVNIRSIQLLDHWEMDQVLHYPGGIQLGSRTLSVKEKIEIALARIKKFDSVTEGQVRDVAISIVDSIGDFMVNEVPDIDDANSRIPVTGNCFVEQLAVQVKQPQMGERRFQVLKKLYNHPLLSNDDRAALILHEAIYRQVIAGGGNTSDGVRYYNYVIATKYLDNATQVNYETLVMNSIFIERNVYNYQYYECKLNTIPFFNYKVLTRKSSSTVNTWLLCEPLELSWSNMKLNLSVGDRIISDNGFASVSSNDTNHSTLSLRQNGEWLTDKIGHDIQISIQLGVPNKIWMNKDKNDPTPNQYHIYLPENKIVYCDKPLSGLDAQHYQLTEQGEIIGCRISKDRVQSYSIDGQNYTLTKGTQFYLHPNYNLKRASFTQETFFKVPGSDRVFAFAPNNVYMEFNTKEEVTYGYLSSPLSLIINGFETNVNRIHINRDNNLNIVLAEHRLKANTYLGKRILANGVRTDLTIPLPNLKKVCGPKYHDGVELTFKTIYVGAGEEFYDPKLDKMVYRVDSHVNVLNEILCEGRFDVPLP